MFQIVNIRKNSMVQCIRNEEIFISEDHFVFKSSNNGETWSLAFSIQNDFPDIVKRIRDKILRLYPVRYCRKNIGIHNVVVLNSGTIIAQYDKIYRYTGNKEKKARPVFNLSSQDIFAPLKNGLAYAEYNDTIYFGEYTCKRPRAIRIIKGRNDGKDWDICYQFPSGHIRHIHSIVPDNNRKGLWVCTGDSDKESALFFTDDDFKTLKTIGTGSQAWRMVSLLPCKNFLIWGSDAGQDAPASKKNYIYGLSLKKLEKKKIALIDKPAYFSFSTGEGNYFISTTYEPKIKRNVSKSTEIFHSKDGMHWKSIFEFQYKKQRNSGRTKYAMAILPLSFGKNSDDILVFSLLNTKKYDFSTLIAKRTLNSSCV